MSKQPKPDSKKYTDLISEIQKGQIKVPKFQRNFVWSLDKTAKLLDSILKGYPIGTFILWETNERLNDINLYPNPTNDLLTIPIDGQKTILITNMQGQIIKSIKTSQRTISINNLPTGHYFVSVFNNDNILLITKQIIYEK